MNGGLTIGGTIHTYDDLNMIPKLPIAFAPPQPKYVIFDIPGADGEIDLTDALTGNIFYNNRKGSIEFLVLSGADYLQSYEDALQAFDGDKKTVVLDDQPGTNYTGRFWVNRWKSFEGYSTIVIDYDVDP